MRLGRRWEAGLAMGMAMGATLSSLIMISVLNRRIWQKSRSRMPASLAHVRVVSDDIPNWLLFRAARSAILQAEKEQGKEYDILSVKDSVKDVSVSCFSGESYWEERCELTMGLSLTPVHGQLSSLSEVLPFTHTRRPTFNEADACSITSASTSSHHGVHQLLVNCSDLDRSRKFGMLLSTIPRHFKEEDNIPLLDSWFDHLGLPLFVAPFDLLLAVPPELMALVEAKVGRVLEGRVASTERDLCVRIRGGKEGGEGRLLCSDSNVTKDEGFPVAPILWLSGSSVLGHRVDEGWGNQAVRALSSAGRSVGRLHNYAYFMFVEHRLSFCLKAFSHFVQSVLALRRSFSLIECGHQQTCFLGEWRDLKFWSDVMAAALQERMAGATSLLQIAGKEKREFRRHFGDAPSFRSLEVMLFPAEDAAGRHKCERAVRFSDKELHKEDGEETREEDTHCVGHIDLLSPCQDADKIISFLVHPRWFHHLASKRRLLSVQILANDRPQQLLRTVMQLLAQLEPRCITVHLDHSKDTMEPAQKLTMKVAQWLGSTFGTRWRRNRDRYLPSLTHRLGFHRNFASKDFTHVLSPTDRLVHATWNALAYAFDEMPAAGACSPNATVIIEDDLLPTHDAVEYFLMGKEIMDKDEEVLVVSAWNDNGFSMRDGLRCVTLRGEYFMSLGWLTTRKVFDRITSLPSLWPSVTVEHRGEQVQGSAINGGWELPFLKLFLHSGVGVYPAVSRVWHQSSKKGWSVNALVQKQILNAHTRLSSNASCGSVWTLERKYDSLISSMVSKSQWVNVSQHRCYKSLLAESAPATFVLATDLGFKSGPITRLFHILGLVKGFGKARGFYKGIIRLFVAQHNLLLLSSRSPFFQHAPKRLRGLVLNKQELSSFLDDSMCAWHKRLSHPLAVVNLPTDSTAAIVITLARQRQSCSSACSLLHRTCHDWASLYTYSPAWLWSGRQLVPLNRSSSLLRGEPGVGYGSYLASSRDDLPVLTQGQVLDGLPRLFRCRAVSEGEEKRICPCLERQFAARAGAAGELSDLQA